MIFRSFLLVWLVTRLVNVLAQSVTVVARDARLQQTYGGGSWSFDNYTTPGDCSTPVVEFFAQGTAMSMSFNGTSITATFYTDTVGGDMLIGLDDQIVKFNNLGASPWGPTNCLTTSWTAAGLNPGNHTISIVNVYGSHIYWKSFEYTPDSPVLATDPSTTSEPQSGSSVSPTRVSAPAASPVPLIVGVVVGVLCLAISLGILAWTYKKFHKSAQSRVYLDDDSGGGDQMVGLSPSTRVVVPQVGMISTEQIMHPYTDHSQQSFPLRRETPRETLQALLAAGLSGAELSAAVRLLEMDASAGSQGASTTDARPESPVPPYEGKRSLSNAN